MKQNGRALEFASEELQMDREIVLEVSVALMLHAVVRMHEGVEGMMVYIVGVEEWLGLSW